jgi:hypothetical protein
MRAAKQQKAHEEKVFLKNSLLSFLAKALFFMTMLRFLCKLHHQKGEVK